MGLGRNLPKEADVCTSFAQKPELIVDWCDVAQVTIDTLPDDALLEIFDFYIEQKGAWLTLVHVCQKWRNVAFGSPLRLNLQLYCNVATPVRQMLHFLPLLPIVIRAFHYVWDADNIVAALE